MYAELKLSRHTFKRLETSLIPHDTALKLTWRPVKLSNTPGAPSKPSWNFLNWPKTLWNALKRLHNVLKSPWSSFESLWCPLKLLWNSLKRNESPWNSSELCWNSRKAHRSEFCRNPFEKHWHAPERFETPLKFLCKFTEVHLKTFGAPWNPPESLWSPLKSPITYLKHVKVPLKLLLTS